MPDGPVPFGCVVTNSPDFTKLFERGLEITLLRFDFIEAPLNFRLLLWSDELGRKLLGSELDGIELLID